MLSTAAVCQQPVSAPFIASKRPLFAKLGEKEWLVLLLWFGLSIFGAGKEIWADKINNYLVFKHVYLHVIAQQPLYIPYPESYSDVNLYGPLFSFVIAPFAWLPDQLGALCWAIFNTTLLFIAIRQLPLSRLQQNIVLIFASSELPGASSYLQFNQTIAACIILSFALILKGKNFWAAFFIVLGTLTKLYGIVGLAFFFFSDDKRKLVWSLLLWGIVLFLLPMLLSSPSYILQTYQEWMAALVEKNARNVQFEEGVLLQDISAMGFIRRTFQLPDLKNIWVLAPALALFLLQYVMLPLENRQYRFYLLCTTLMFPVLFSTSSEAPTYIIAFPAVCIWYVMQEPSRRTDIFFLLALLFCSFSHSDLLTPWMRNNVAQPYAIKALPCLLVWLTIIYQVLSRQFQRIILVPPL